MKAAAAILPVVFMLGLGCFARKMKILSEEQNGGIKKLIFTLLLPILVFNATFTMNIDPKYIKITGFMFILQCVTLLAGYGAFRLIKTDYSHVSPYLMTTIEGGNAFYPLYIGLVGAGFSSYFVLLDVPGIFIVFLVFPMIIARKTSESAGFASMMRNVYTNPVICGLIAGILLNVTGVSAAFARTGVYEAYCALADAATAPIAPLILFTLGYSFSLGRDNLAPMLITLAVRLVLMGCGIAVAFMLFPWILEDAQLRIAVILFMMSPPAFATPIILEKLYKKGSDGQYCSTYISLHMLVTVIAFALIAVFTA
ncbi:MAG: hypothetical protein E7337_04960 [Clostridiales bacterium]|nr:hypothetical protein [Clostridiales bacterium]